MKIDFPVAIDNDYAIMARFRQPLLAGALTSSMRKGGFATMNLVRADTKGRKGSSNNYWRSRVQRLGDHWLRSTPVGVEAEADWADLKSPEKLSRPRAHRELCLSGWSSGGQASRLCCSCKDEAQ